MRTALPFAYASVAALVLACSDSTDPTDPPEPPPDPAGSFQVAPATATLGYGQTLQFTTTYGGKRGTAEGAVAWQSSDENVAVVRNGLVKGVSGGQARIVATWGGYQATAVVNVIAAWKKHEQPPVCQLRTWRGAQRLLTQC